MPLFLHIQFPHESQSKLDPKPRVENNGVQAQNFLSLFSLLAVEDKV